MKYDAAVFCIFLWTLAISMVFPPVSGADSLQEKYMVTPTDEQRAPLKLKELLEYAKHNNPLLKAAYLKYEALKEKVPQAATLPDPRFSYGYFLNPIETRNGPQKHKVGLSQHFPLGGKLKLKETLARKQAMIAYYQYVTSLLHLRTEVANYYHEYSYLHEELLIKKEHLNLLKAMESVVDIGFKTGKTDQSALILVQIEQGKVEDEIRELSSLRPSLSSSILAAVGDKNTRILPWPPLVIPVFPQFTIEKLRAEMMESNPTLRISYIKEKERRIASSLAQKVTVPDLTFGLEQYDIGDGGSNALAASVSINVPVWKKKTQAMKREAKKKLESTHEVTEETTNRLCAKLDMTLYYYNNSKRKVSLYTKTLIPKAKQAIDVALKGFQTGNVSLIELLDAQRTLLEFELTGKRQRTNAQRNLVQIEALLGRDGDMK